jgi:hypothetical protein
MSDTWGPVLYQRINAVDEDLQALDNYIRVDFTNLENAQTKYLFDTIENAHSDTSQQIVSLGLDITEQIGSIDRSLTKVQTDLTTATKTLTETIIPALTRVQAQNELNTQKLTQVINTLTALPEETAKAVEAAIGKELAAVSVSIDALSVLLVSTIQEEGEKNRTIMTTGFSELSGELTKGFLANSTQLNSLRVELSATIKEGDTKISESINLLTKTLEEQLKAIAEDQILAYQAMTLFFTEFWTNLRDFFSQLSNVTPERVSAAQGESAEISAKLLGVISPLPVSENPSLDSFISEINRERNEAVV